MTSSSGARSRVTTSQTASKSTAEIVVNKDVTHTRDYLPVNPGVQIFVGRVDPADRFAEHLKFRTMASCSVCEPNTASRPETESALILPTHSSTRIIRRRAAISQRNGFPQDSFPYERAQGSENNHLHLFAQEFFQLGREASGKPRACDSSHINKQIDVAVGRVLAPCRRAEQADIPGTVAGGHAQDFVPAFVNCACSVHLFRLYRPKATN
jgi:hypothetical protein